MAAPVTQINYGNPIQLSLEGTIEAHRSVSVTGRNKGVKYNPMTRLFEIQNPIVLTIEGDRYQFYEYHFHVSGDHTFEGKRYPAELHYSLVKLNDDEKYLRVPNSSIPGNRNIMGIAVPVEQGGEVCDLEKLNIQVPSSFFEYNGIKMIPSYNPVLWLVGDVPIELDLEQVAAFSLPPYPTLQPVNSRIILFSC